MAVTIYVSGADGHVEDIYIPQAESTSIGSNDQALLLLRHQNGSVIGMISAANVIAVVADKPEQPQ